MEIYNRKHELKCMAVIDNDDIERVSKIHWNTNSKGYIFGNINGNMIRLHHFILDFKWNGDQQYTVDHINRNKLDNRKCNLRIADMTTQNRNRSIQPKIKRFITMSESGKYKVRIYTKDKKQLYLGSYSTLEEAIKIRDNYIRENDDNVL